MKKTHILALGILLLLQSNSANCQKVWFQENTTWHYGILLSALDPLNIQEYAIYEVTGDSLIDSRIYSIIEKTRYFLDGSKQFLGYELYNQEGDQIYYYQSGHRHLLYDFSLEKGDNWTIRIPNDSDEPHSIEDTVRTVHIDSTSVIVVNSDSLKVLYTTFSNNPNTNKIDWQFKGPIIEKIGSTYLLPGIWWFVDMDIPYLRCFKDSVLSYIVYPDIECDGLFTKIQDSEPKNQDISITQIANEKLFYSVHNNAYKRINYNVFDITGKMILNGHAECAGENSISFSGQNKGLFVIIFTSNNEVISTYKFITY